MSSSSALHNKQVASTIVLSVLHRYADSDNPFGIFKLFLQYFLLHAISEFSVHLYIQPCLKIRKEKKEKNIIVSVYISTPNSNFFTCLKLK